MVGIAPRVLDLGSLEGRDQAEDPALQDFPFEAGKKDLEDKGTWVGSKPDFRTAGPADWTQFSSSEDKPDAAPNGRG
jgi:hypothetical protein